MIKRILVVAAIAVAIGLSYKMTYTVGKLEGAKGVQRDWDKHEDARSAEINKIRGELNVLMAQHAQKQKEYEDELAASALAHEDELSRYRREYDDRLQLANNRAGVYQRQARGNEAERENLARHAAELDRSLEEGRSLVRELGQTLRQREVTIKALGGIILNDRTLLESK